MKFALAHILIYILFVMTIVSADIHYNEWQYWASSFLLVAAQGVAFLGAISMERGR